MDNQGPLAVIGLVVGSSLLSLATPNSFAIERSVRLLLLVIASLAVICILLGRYITQKEGSETEQKYASIPLDDVGQDRSHREDAVKSEDATYPSSLRKLRILFIALVIAICLRVEVYRRVIKDIQCAGTSYESLLPLAFAFLDFLLIRRHQVLRVEEEADASMYETAEQYLTHTKYRYLVPTALYGLSAVVLQTTSRAPRSTYICATTLPEFYLIPYLQHFGVVLNFCMAYCVDGLVHGVASSGGRRSLGKAFVSIGWAFGISTVILCIASGAWFAFTPEDRKWIKSIPKEFVWSAVKFDMLICIPVVAAIFAIDHIGVMTTTMAASFSSSCAMAIASAYANVHPFPPLAAGWSYLFFCLFLLGLALYFNARTVAANTGLGFGEPSRGVVPGWLYGTLLVLFTIQTALWFAHSSNATFHPIDMMMYDAKRRHESYVQQASTSQNLSMAIAEYHQRYNRRPPPAFDKWYDFATAREALVIDDFDSIHENLLPFWGLSPAEIRQRTWYITANPWNDVASISIRDGKTEISPNVVGTHRWMLDGIISMVDQFGKWLPDMDIGFNLNDECRVSVPFEVIEPMREAASAGGGLDQRQSGSFSNNRVEGWKLIPDEPLKETPLKELSFQRTFRAFGTSGCPPDSRARNQDLWDVSRLCTECASHHSLGVFLANWTESGNVCNQPDMQNLHGLYLSPAAYKASHDLYPIFSQSKVHGYNDILYPSPWNYQDKVKYAPTEEFPDRPFISKNDTLFWRGATSEGVSPGSGTWKGMARQRFIHLANAINDTKPSQSVLLPYPFASSRGKLAYTYLSPHDLSAHLPTSVKIVETINRCGGPDCEAEAKEFAPLVPPSDFQHHWTYKYLLDLDGAGFSGRFLPFLASRSLPFKAALFREWYDDRLTPWLHFVPLDLRGHGLWATLLYFVGIEGKIKGKNVSVAGHEREGELIAEKGREWAGMVLRKQDMEIYMFRLLLEWGRMTDDRRDELGFSLTS